MIIKTNSPLPTMGIGAGTLTPLAIVPDAPAVEVFEAVKVFESGRSPWARLRGKAAKPAKRVVAVDHVSFVVRRGEIFGVLGPNGTGKSTLIRLMSTLLMPDSGTVRIFGLDVERDEIGRQAPDQPRLGRGVVLQEAVADGEPDVRRSALRLTPACAQARDRRDPDAPRHRGQARSSRRMEDMSRGMQQKVAIARAFLTAPVLLLLDEPTTGLDPHSKREVQAFVLEMRDKHDATVVLTTHDMQEADGSATASPSWTRAAIVALDTPAASEGLVRRRRARPPTLEDVFLG